VSVCPWNGAARSAVGGSAGCEPKPPGAGRPTSPRIEKPSILKVCIRKPVVGLIVNVAAPWMAKICVPSIVSATWACVSETSSVPFGLRAIARLPLSDSVSAIVKLIPRPWKSNAVLAGMVTEPSASVVNVCELAACVLILKTTVPLTDSPLRPSRASWPRA
jgi:hypothetical protein